MSRRISVTFALVFAAVIPLRAFAADDQEAKIGADYYQQLKKKGEIISSSPYYAVLNPVVVRIKRIADPQYQYPFHFILVHEKDPNAFAVPGGNVYVTDSLMTFVENTEELAGVLCHETSHDIHHDVVNNNAKNQRLGLAATALGYLLGGVGGTFTQAAISYAADFQSLHFSRSVETAADLKGSDTCAEAGFNPWGMVWLFRHFAKDDSHGGMEMLADHPTDSHRISDLEAHFAANPERFGRYHDNIALATPLRHVIPAKPNSGTSTHRRPRPAESGANAAPAPPAAGPAGNDVPRFP